MANYGCVSFLAGCSCSMRRVSLALIFAGPEKRAKENLVDIPIVFGLTLITFQLFPARLPFVYLARDML